MHNSLALAHRSLELSSIDAKDHAQSVACTQDIEDDAGS